MLYWKRHRSELKNLMNAYVDTDWASSISYRHSTTRYMVLVNGGPISWKSKRQSVTALWSAELEYVASSTCAKALTEIRRLYSIIVGLKPFNDKMRLPATKRLIEDTAALALENSVQVSRKSKYTSVKFHQVRDLIRNGHSLLKHVFTKDQVTDILMKEIDYCTLSRLRAHVLN